MLYDAIESYWLSPGQQYLLVQQELELLKKPHLFAFLLFLDLFEEKDC